MAERESVFVQTSEWFVLYHKALRAGQEALSSATQSASLAMSQRLRELGYDESRERSDILSGLGDLYVLRRSAERLRLLRQPQES